MRKFSVLHRATKYLSYIRRRCVIRSSFMILKKRPLLTQKRLLGLFLISLEKKTRNTQTALVTAFNKWKTEHLIEDLQETIQLHQNDLIIERSKLITIEAFSMLNLKIEYLGMAKALRRLKKVQQIMKMACRLGKILRK